MYKAKIKDINKERHQASNTDFIKVEFDILDEENNVLKTKKIGLKTDITENNVRKEVNKHIVEYGSEVIIKKREAKKNIERKELNKMKNTLVGQTI